MAIVVMKKIPFYAGHGRVLHVRGPGVRNRWGSGWTINHIIKLEVLSTCEVASLLPSSAFHCRIV